MNRISRRGFLKRSAVVSSGVWAGLGSTAWLRAAGANDAVRLGVVGVGSRVKSGGMGRNEIRHFRAMPGVRVVALCDVDSQKFHRSRPQPPRRRSGGRHPRRPPLGRAGPPGQYFTPRRPDRARARDRRAGRGEQGIGRGLPTAPGPPVGQRGRFRQNARHARSHDHVRFSDRAVCRRAEPAGERIGGPAISPAVRGSATGVNCPETASSGHP